MPSRQEVITRKNRILLKTSTPRRTKLSSSAIIEISNFESHTDLIDFGLRYMNDAQKYSMSDCSDTSYTSQLSDSAGQSALTSPCPVTARQSRKRKRNVGDWKVNVNKRLRNAVESYVTKSGQIKRKREIKMGCCVNCRNKCRKKITEDERQSIFHGFRSTCCLSTQREYLCKV